MFAFFKNDSFINFWANQIGDIFCHLTIQKMKWDIADIKLLYYPTISGVPEHYEFNDSLHLVIQKVVTTTQTVEEVDENGVVNTVEAEVTELVVDRIVEPEVYFNNGIMVKPC